MSRRARQRQEAMDAKYLAMAPMDDTDQDHEADAAGMGVYNDPGDAWRKGER